jgi:formylglycine-generating enzyme required for sulfatase activity
MGQFKFAMVNTDATATFWSNDGTSTAGSQPTHAVSLTVTKGLYAVLLGDATLANMTVIPNTVFNNPDVRLRVWFDDGTANGPQLLTPDQRIAAVGYAMMAGNVPDAAITSAKLAAGAVGSAQIADFSVTGDKLRLGTETGTAAEGEITLVSGALSFTRTFDYPFTAPPAVSLLSPGWTLGPVSATGFSATFAFSPLVPDSVGDVGQYTSQVLVDGKPAISYQDAANGFLKYVRASDAAGTAWGTSVTVDTNGKFTSLAVVDGKPAISYLDSSTGDLKYVRATDAGGTVWDAPVVLAGLASSQYTSLAVVDGKPAVIYSASNSLKFLRATDASGTAWGLPVTIGGLPGPGRFASLAVVDGKPAISYISNIPSPIRYLRATDAEGTQWGVPMVLNPVGAAGQYCSLKVINGNPAISYYETINDDLKFLRATDAGGTTWGTPVIVDSTDDVGQFMSLAVVDGRPAISYYDATHSDLKYVQATDADGTAWGTPTTLDSVGNVGQHTSLALADGGPAISYYDATNGDLKFIQLSAALRWQASDGSIAPITAATVAAGAIGSTQLATNAVQAGNISSGAVGSSQIASGAVGSTQLDPAIGLWTRNGNDISYLAGRVGIGTSTPTTTLEVTGTAKATAFSGAFTGDGAGLTNIPASAVVGLVPETPPAGMALIPAGAFIMGNSTGDTRDADMTNAIPVSVTLSAFYMAVNEVSLSQWQSVYTYATGHGYTLRPGAGKGTNHPVHSVNWYDVVKWCNARSEMESLMPCYTVSGVTYKTGEDNDVVCNWAANGYRLPTEAEWEKAARGGLIGQRFPWGNVVSGNLANYYGSTTSYSYDLGPNEFNALGNDGTMPYTTPVGSFAPNGYGLNDMAGNVNEWCWDWYGTPYAGGSDPLGPPSSGSGRVLRGGYWNGDAGSCRVAGRYYVNPGFGSFIGFRPARSSVP